MHDDDAVGEPVDHRQVVADEQAREAEVGLQLLEQVEHARLHRHVERALVGSSAISSSAQRERTGDADALTLTAGELVRIPVAEHARQLDGIQELLARAR